MTKYRGRFIRIRNLEKYQHYKSRNAPWVKLHQAVLEDYDFSRLPDAAKWHCLGLLLLSARTGNEIPADPAWIKARLNASSSVDLQLLVSVGFIDYCEDAEQDASNSLAGCKQVAMREGEREGEGDREREETFVGSGAGAPNRPSASSSEIEWRIQQTWDAHLKQWAGFYEDENGKVPPVRPTLTEPIRKAIRDSLLTFDGHLLAAADRERWVAESKTRGAGVGIYLDPFLAGKAKDNNVRDGGRRYLNHERPWVPQKGKPHPVERFSELYFEAKSLSSTTQPERGPDQDGSDDVAF